MAASRSDGLELLHFAGRDISRPDQAYRTDTRYWIGGRNRNARPVKAIGTVKASNGLFEFPEAPRPIFGGPTEPAPRISWEAPEFPPEFGRPGDARLIAGSAGLRWRGEVGFEEFHNGVTTKSDTQAGVTVTTRMATPISRSHSLPTAVAPNPSAVVVSPASVESLRRLLSGAATAEVRTQPINLLSRDSSGTWHEYSFGAECFIKPPEGLTGKDLFEAAASTNETARLDRLAVTSIREWITRGLPPECYTTLSVNISRSLLREPDLRDLLSGFQGIGREVVFELDEHLEWLEDLDFADQVAKELPFVKYALDDMFGPDAESSFMFRPLLRHALAWLKIDVAFFRACCELGQPLGLELGAYLRSARSEELRSVVEGIETDEDYMFLIACLEAEGLDSVLIQGFGVARLDQPRRIAGS